MNAFLWLLQLALAFLSFSGGAYKIFMFAELAKMPPIAALPQGAWAVVGVFEMVCGVLLVVPAATKWKPILTPLAAIMLAVESLALAVLYASYSLELTVTNPLVWVVAMAVMAALVAFGRRSSPR